MYTLESDFFSMLTTNSLVASITIQLSPLTHFALPSPLFPFGNHQYVLCIY